MRYAALAGLAFLAVSALGHAALLADQFGGVKPVGVTAHRAGALHAPENTLAALRQAIAEGADAAEIDVQETADGVVVVLHDQDLRRLTGVARNVWEITSAELRALDAGSWFGPAFRGEHIATLEEFLEAAKGKIRLNVELKYNGHDKKLAERVIDLLRKHDFLNQAVITSLEYRGLEETRRLEPNLKTGYIVSASVGDLTKLDVDFLSVREGLVTPALCREAGGRGWPIHAWGVNDRPKMEAVLDLGADDLITDNVVLALEVLRERAARPKPEIILARLHAWLRAGE
jgi:glycerophosphoryl diester phosphodiesterase